MFLTHVVVLGIQLSVFFDFSYRVSYEQFSTSIRCIECLIQERIPFFGASN